jgi:hypothetical protein
MRQKFENWKGTFLVTGTVEQEMDKNYEDNGKLHSLENEITAIGDAPH